MAEYTRCYDQHQFDGGPQLTRTPCCDVPVWVENGDLTERDCPECRVPYYQYKAPLSPLAIWVSRPVRADSITPGGFSWLEEARRLLETGERP